jgi:CO/xanthine dehydrogenase Mo-binding subunit
MNSKQDLKTESKKEYKYIGRKTKVREDVSLIQGKGHYLDDIEIPGTLYMAYATSTYGHAKIKSLDKSKCLKLPGVVAVFTGLDIKDKMSPFMQIAKPPSGDLKDYPLAVDKVRFFGEPVAAVIALDPYVAEDGAELIEVDYEPLPVVLDGEKALEESAPKIHENIGSNVVWKGIWDLGSTEEAFEKADLIVEDTVYTHRYASVPLETSSVIASYDEGDDIFTVYSVNQMPMFSLPLICGALRIPPSKFRMIVPPNVGGAFGGKIINYTHITLASYISKVLKKPVKYVETRTENIMFGTHNNERIYHVSLAVKKDGKVIGAKMNAVDNCGAYPRYEPAGAVIWAQVVPGIYDVKDVYVEFTQVVSNKGPTGPVRGYSRVQHNFMWERMMNKVAEKLGLDPSEVRIKNFIQPKDMPYVGPSNTIYDGGNYPAAFEHLLEALEYNKWREKQLEYRKKGKFIGLGLSAVIDSGANNFSQIKIINRDFPASGNSDMGFVSVDQFGDIVARTGTTDQGQSHATTFSQIVGEVFDTNPEEIKFQTGFDSTSNVWAAHSGAYASRSAVIAGTALYKAAQNVKAKVLKIAASIMGENPEDLDVKNKEVISKVTGKKIPFGQIASVAWSDIGLLPDDIEPGLMSYAMYKPDFTFNMPDERNRINNTLTYSYTMHGTLVEVDPETFQIKILKHVVVSDPGVVINPQVVEGQEMGATMHGMSAALMENIVYDEDGILLSSNFWDYNVMGSKQMPEIKLLENITRSTSSLLGVRGIGEGGGGPVGSIVNAVEDALKPLGIKLYKSNLSSNEIFSLGKNEVKH